MLLRRDVAHGVQVLTVRGPVAEADASALAGAISDAMAIGPRGILVDLSEAGPVSATGLDVLRQARLAAPGWPRPSLLVCCTSAEVTEALRTWVPVHADRDEGLAHVDDRSSAPRRRMHLDSSPRSPAVARAMAADAVEGLDLGPVADDLALVVSEMVTNAIRYAEPPVEIEIQTGEFAVTVAVADASPVRPAPRDADASAETGRGLGLIDLLAAETGVRPQPPGKTVWAELPRP